MKNFKILGLEAFDVVERDRIITLSDEYYEKIKRDVEGILVLHGKKHDKEGKQAKFSFHARLEAPNPVVEVKGDDWDLSKALHKVFRKVENAIQKKYKTKGKNV